MTPGTPPIPSRGAVPLSVGFISLGCAKNLVDSEYMASALAAAGISLAPVPELADVIVVNTCAFVDDAKNESIDAILEVCDLKKAGTCKAVLVAGCLPQRYREELAESLPEVDGFLGLDDLDSVPAIVRRLAGGERNVVQISTESTTVFESPAERILFTGGPHAYVKVAEGCDHGCSFCVIPAIRGRYRSRPPEGIIAEARNLLAAGVRELDLISQDVTWYGCDLSDGTDLASLLGELGAIDGDYWIRLLYGHPAHVTDGLLETIAGTPHVCRYLDVPVQHSHPDILGAMRRNGGAEAVKSLAERARAAVPGISLRTTLLVGYPGETEEHFAHLLDYVRRSEFDNLGVFVFSPQENTPAAAMGEPVAPDVAGQRRHALMVAQQEIVQRKGNERVGREDTVLLERPCDDDPASWVGRSEREAPEIDGQVVVSGLSPDVPEGEFVTVEYTGVDGYDMRATRARKAEG